MDVGISDFQLEILNGCRWNCSGCNIDKTIQDGFRPGDIQKLTNLFVDMKDKGVILGNLAIGPTDFMSSGNFESVMTMELKPMFDMYGAILMNTTFLSDKETMEKVAAILRPLVKGCQVKFTVPIEPRHYKNPKYVKTLLENKDYFCSLLPESTFGKFYLIGNLHEYRAYQEDPFQNDKITFEEYSKGFHDTWNGQHLDLVISDGRYPLSNAFGRSRVKSMVRYLNSLYLNALSSDSSKRIVNFTYGKSYEGTDYDYVYRNGDLYWTVFIGEPFVTFEDDFKVPPEDVWTFDMLIRNENMALLKAFEYMSKTHECSSCEFANRCARGGLLLLMKNLDVKECFAPKDAFARIRQAA